MRKLSDRQQRILDFVGEYTGDHGYPPSIREIGKAVKELDISMDRLKTTLGTYWDKPEPEVIKKLRPRLELLLQKMRGYVAKMDALVFADEDDD